MTSSALGIHETQCVVNAFHVQLSLQVSTFYSRVINQRLYQ